MKYITSLILTVLGTAAFAQAALQPTDAEVRKIDRDSGRITLKHGEIKNLDMPPMTMVFQAQDKAALDKFKVGDKVRFTADKVNGTYTVLTLIAAP